MNLEVNFEFPSLFYFPVCGVCGSDCRSYVNISDCLAFLSMRSLLRLPIPAAPASVSEDGPRAPGTALAAFPVCPAPAALNR